MMIGSVIHLLLSTLGIRGWAPYVMAGVATGLALGHPQFECPSELRGMACARWLWRDLFAFAAMPGLGAALAFWLVLRPDRAGAR